MIIYNYPGFQVNFVFKQVLIYDVLHFSVASSIWSKHTAHLSVVESLQSDINLEKYAKKDNIAVTWSLLSSDVVL